MVYPRSLVKEFQSGFRKGICLSQFTREALRAGSSRVGRRLARTLAFDGRQVVIEDQQDDFSLGLKLTMLEITEVKELFPQAIRQYMTWPRYSSRESEKMADQVAVWFTRMFDHAIQRRDFKSRLDVYVEYFQHKVQQYVDKRGEGCRPDFFDEQLWGFIDREHHDRRAAAEERRRESYLNKSKDKDKKKKKQPSSESAPSSTLSFRPIRCMYCGSTDHRHGDHPEDKPSKAASFKDGQFRSKSGKGFCHGFNGPKSCPRADCRYEHLCAICGSSKHGAQDCSLP